MLIYRILRICATGIAILISVLLVMYLKVRIYELPRPNPFSGQHWYNPYVQTGDTLLKANFHAHSHCWWGIAHGTDSEEELIEAYVEREYDIVGISNYQHISSLQQNEPLYIPLYEHGLNAQKIHTLVLGAPGVSFANFPYHFSIHQTQQMINSTADTGVLTAIAHPVMGRLSMDDMAHLSNYELLEVGNTLGMSTKHWDAALSAGRAIWILCNDDTHSLEDEPTFIKWNMIMADAPTAQAALDALRTGRHYGVESYDTQCDDNALLSVDMTRDTLHIEVLHPVNRIDLYGQNGVVRASVSGTNLLRYAAAPDDTYLRAEIHQDHCVYYLNPLIRTSAQGTFDAPPSAVPDRTRSWLWRVVVVLLLAVTILLYWRILKSIPRGEQ